jgi:hypothetical protein
MNLTRTTVVYSIDNGYRVSQRIENSDSAKLK